MAETLTKHEERAQIRAAKAELGRECGKTAERLAKIERQRR
jgi:hypothetical protein